MPTKLISFSTGGVNETVAAGDKLVIKARNTNGEFQPSIAVFPASGATAKVSFSHTPLDVIFANPEDPIIKWHPWSLGDITPASGIKEDTFASRVKAILIEATGGQVVVQGTA